jgi:small GTP-binding protein
MPANLTPDYLAAEKRYRQAKTDDEKLACLEEMLSVIPKHKGTDKMQADLKRRISQMKTRISQSGASTRKGFSHKVRKEGAGQVVLLGEPNVGKSQLLTALTNARPDVAPYPFTTREPVPGMMYFENVQIQLVDIPPVSDEHTEHWVPEMVRGADGVLLVVDLSAPDVLNQVENPVERLESIKIRLVGALQDSCPPNVTQKKTMVVANKVDMVETQETLDALRDLYAARFPLLVVSARNGAGLEELRHAVFDLLDVVRIYSKSPGKQADMDTPFTLPRGSTVLNLAQAVHKDFTEGLKFARIWGSAKFDGQQVTKDYVLADGDIVELHVS